MKRICVLTATRAEYGLLRPVMKRVQEDEKLELRIVVTGMHLSPEFGLTYQEIEKDDFEIDEKIPTLLSSDTPESISETMGLALIGFASYFKRTQPDFLIVLGDRYETLAVCLAAMNQKIPIGHMHGGEITEGAVDDGIRHAITKLSYLHFTSTHEYKKRVIQLGEAPERVFCVGATGVENILNMPLLSKKSLEESIGHPLENPFLMVTFHPVTLEERGPAGQFQELLNVFEKHPEYEYIFTKANADANGRIVNKMIDDYVQNHSNAIAFQSMGALRYLSALKYCAGVVGNSSSGIIEAPSFHVPVINIGDRQKGRLQSEGIINCRPEENEIEKALSLAGTDCYRETLKEIQNPYGDGNTSKEVVEHIKEALLSNSIDLKKHFYDLEVPSFE